MKTGTRTVVLLLFACAAWSLCLPLPAADKKPAEQRLIGTHAQQWKVTDWLNSSPLELNDLQGKVVLVRWWTAPECPYCRATAPALNEFFDVYHKDGLEVLGFYHHKSRTPLRLEDVRKYSAEFGFKFPVAVDPNWQTLHRWWLDQGDQQWTGVSFLLDRKGIIRHIHPGGEYIKGDKDYEKLKAKIEGLLKE